VSWRDTTDDPSANPRHPACEIDLPCPGCGRPMARVGGPGARRGWTCVNCNAAGDPEEDRAYSDDELVDPEAERPCSCEESERLKARVAELQAMNATLAEDIRSLGADIEQRKAECRTEYAAHARTIASLTALRERLESLCKGSGIPGAEPGIVLTRQVLEIVRG
jgi:hypothetical protein